MSIGVGNFCKGFAKFWQRGEPMVWATGAALALMLLMTAVLLVVVAVNGLGVFWPAPLVEAALADGGKLLGREITSQVNPDNGVRSVQFKTANREFDPRREDFHWIDADKIRQVDRPADAMALERSENGDFFGFLKEVKTPSLEMPPGADLQERFAAALAVIQRQRREKVEPLAAELSDFSDQLQEIRRATMKLDYQKGLAAAAAATRASSPRWTPACRNCTPSATGSTASRKRLSPGSSATRPRSAATSPSSPTPKESRGRSSLADVVRFCQPNRMGLAAKIWHYAGKVWELLTAAPRESNTEGGLFPAIFGTVMLIFLMAIACFPLGVLAGVYLGEYARDGVLVRLVRIAVNNLAGIPSIVYGIFGLGFFIYGIGSALDGWLYPERVAAGSPTFGTGGILWASLTLGLLTAPVVIVATEEAIRAIPRGVRESSYALGATKFQTLLRVLLPLASPGIMTGFILAMARAAGEVAPLMITGVVKLAPTLPLDGKPPFFHLDRKFMHLGFHIYDVGFQSPNVEATKPMVYVTTLLLVLIVLLLSSVAIWLRNRMKKRCQSRTI